ncbi:MAG: alpha/beta hydrolase fold domain-containing protein, partial [Chloroflexota bacterium]|nr:alpha/beta hydrolase fold domain-containing protein [Chloroflexota bacterium]
MTGQVYVARSSGHATRRQRSTVAIYAGVTRPARAAGRAAAFFVKLFPMWSSSWLDHLTRRPVREVITYPTRSGDVEAELYRPPGSGPHPAMVVCLGVVPFGVDHPQVPRLEEALARSGFAALIHWSPAMRDLRLEPTDVEETAQAYEWLVEQPYADPARSGLMGTCVGGAFALMAAAHPAIRDRVSFVAAFAPYSSMWTLAHDIASSSRARDGAREPWAVDQLTRKVFVRTLTSYLEPREGDLLRRAFSDEGGTVDTDTLSAEGQA